jgi:L-fuconolactonase
MLIDAHQHFWRIDRGDYGWLTPAQGALYRDFLPGDLAPTLARLGIAKTVLVQAAPTLAETAFLMTLAEQTPFVAGVVGWIDFTAPDAQETIALMAANPYLVGLRPMIHDIADPNWLLRLDLVPAIKSMISHRLVFDALVRPQHLTALRGFIERYPELTVVIDHGAKPEIKHGVQASWRNDLRAIASHQRVVCKLSGLITEAAPDWRPEQVLPYCDRLLELFGPQRLLWGSDWPVVNTAGGYDVWRALTAEALQELKAADRADILGGTAARIYLGHGRGVA